LLRNVVAFFFFCAGFFVEGYRIEGWEFAVLLRKLLLVLILVGLEPAGVPQLQGLLGLWVCFFALLCQWRWRPFSRAQENRLEELGLIASAMALLSGVLWAAVPAPFNISSMTTCQIQNAWSPHSERLFER
jgi:hypothetical protein